MENTEAKAENTQENNDKESKKFDANIKKLVALFNGEKAFKKPKVANKDVNNIIEELTKENKEKLVKDFKEKASKLLTSKVEFDKFVVAKQKEMEQAIQNKKKEFNKEMADCFQIIENIDKLTSDYTTAFNNMGSGSEAAPQA